MGRQIKCSAVLAVFAFSFVSGSSSLRAGHIDGHFAWEGTKILGEAGLEDPNFFPAGDALFEISGNTLTLTLTYTGSSKTIVSQNQVLTGLTWDLDGFAGSLTAQTAMINTSNGSMLVDNGTAAADWNTSAAGAGLDPNDLSGQWAYKAGITAGDLGSFGVGAMGDILFGADTFGTMDIIDDTKTLNEPAPNGSDFGIVGHDVDLTKDGLPSHGPYVQNSMVFTFDFTGDLTLGMIRNVRGLYGTEGAPVPEPSTVVLLGAGLIGVGVFARTRRRRVAG